MAHGSQNITSSILKLQKTLFLEKLIL